MHNRKTFTVGAALAAAVVAVAVTYGILAVHPFPHSPLNEFLATLGRANAALWPMQVVWYLAAPPDLGRGVIPDYGMLAAALITAGLIIWRDRTSFPAWQSVTAGLLLALMIAWSGHEDVLMGLALILAAVTLVQAIKGHRRPPRARVVPPTQTGKLKVS